MPFDVQGARAAGYSDAEIADELARDTNFDTAGARSAGYTDSEIIAELQPARPSATATDRVQAIASGASSGVASTLGLPIDTALNALDVGKAAIGLGYLGADKVNRAFGGEGVVAPPFVNRTRRDNVLGSSENIKKGLNAVGVDTAPVRPDDRTSRYLSTAAALGSGIVTGGIYNKLGIPSGITPRPGTPPGSLPPGSSPPAPPPGSPGGTPLPAPVGLNATEKATLAAGERLGLKVTPGVRAGSPTLRRVEARLESQPATAGPFDAIKANNARVIQQQFLRSIGESGDEVSSTALANAASRIGKVFDEAAANNKVAYDPQLEAQLAQIGSRAAAELTEAEAPLIGKQLNEIVTKAAQAGGNIEGPAFQSIYSTLGRLSKNGSGGVKDLAGDVRDALHEALIRSAGPKAAGTLREARDQYRVLLTAEKSGAIDPGSGTLRAGQLAGAFARSDKGGYLRGYNDTGLYDALRFANTRTFGPIVGDSGTATRLGGFPDSLYRGTLNAAGNLATRGYIAAGNTAPGGAVLNTGVRAGTATDQIVREMLRIPGYNPTPSIIGLDAAEDEFRRGLYQ